VGGVHPALATPASVYGKYIILTVVTPPQCPQTWNKAQSILTKLKADPKESHLVTIETGAYTEEVLHAVLASFQRRFTLINAISTLIHAL